MAMTFLRRLGRAFKVAQASTAADRRVAPAVKLVNLLLVDSVKRGASQLEIRHQRGEALVRYRLNGVLRDIMPLPLELQERVVRRIRLMAGLTLADPRVAQAGWIRITIVRD